jgi:hypothetical protein
MWCHVRLVRTDISEEHVYIFRVEKSARSVSSFLGFFCPEDEDETFLRNVGSYNSHSATSQKTTFFIAVKPSNPTSVLLIFYL